jgi:hypothetical protein
MFCIFSRAALPLSIKRRNSSRSWGVRLLVLELLLEQGNDSFQLSVDLLKHPAEAMENLHQLPLWLASAQHETIVAAANRPCKMSRFGYATAGSAARAFSNTSSPSRATTRTVSPSPNSPSSNRSASGFSTSRWIARFSGRAP